MQTDVSKKTKTLFCDRVCGRWGVMILLSGLVVSGGCRHGLDFTQWFKKDKTTDDSFIAVRPVGIDMEMLNRAALRERWTSRIPFGRSTQLIRLYVHDHHVYALDSHNVLTALDSDKGTIVWSSILAQPKLPASQPFYYNGVMVWCFGSTVVQIRESDGKIIQKLSLSIEVSTNAVRNEERLFVGSTDRRFYSLRLSDGVPMWQDVFVEAPVGVAAMDQDNVYFVTQDRILNAYTAKERKQLWTFKANGDLTGAVIDGQQCFLPSGDTTLRCFDTGTGKLLWGYLSGGTLADMPVLTGSYCYQPIQYKSLICVNRQDGSLLWELKNGKDFIAENGPVTYVMMLNHEFTLMNNTTGEREVSFYAPQVDLYAVNRENANCYLARSDGVIWALTPDVVHSPIQKAASGSSSAGAAAAP